MRLLNITTFQFENIEPENAQYAVLSHKWADSPGKEISFQDFHDAAKVDKSKLDKPEKLPAHETAYGVAKIAWTASVARERKLDYIWIDTCCIDKTNSAELSEAINSMFKWYRLAVECYVYLPDVSWEGNEASKAQFRESVWFQRGWTLQELLAPREARFYDREWKFIDTKTHLSAEIGAATNIDLTYLRDDFRSASIATKMSWASRRKTTKPEDQAYCLLGIFNISMDARYGEGEKAFIRLQKELIVNYNDESIFAWTLTSAVPSDPHGLLAPEPACFRDSANITHRSGKHKPRPPYEWTAQGIGFTVPSLWPDNPMRSRHKVRLNCWRIGEEKSKNTIAIRLAKTDRGWQRNNCGELGLAADWTFRTCLLFIANNPTTKVLFVPQNA